MSSIASGDPTSPTNTLLCSSHPISTIKATGRDGDSLGSVYSLMINKRTGQTEYAVLTIGGFIGIGKSYYPLPFQLLSYDQVADGYVVMIDKRLLEGGPNWTSSAPEFDQAYADRVAKYYDVAGVDISVHR